MRRRLIPRPPGFAELAEAGALFEQASALADTAIDAVARGDLAAARRAVEAAERLHAAGRQIRRGWRR